MDNKLRVVPPGEAVRVVAAYQRSVQLAGQVHELLQAAGVDPSTVRVVPSLTEAGAPVVCLVPLTDSARHGLAQILDGCEPTSGR